MWLRVQRMSHLLALLSLVREFFEVRGVHVIDPKKQPGGAERIRYCFIEQDGHTIPIPGD